MIYGLVGFLASGKGTIAELLSKSIGAPVHSFSDILCEELAHQNKEATRENLQELAISLRAKQGNGFLAEKLVEKIGVGSAIVDGFRSPDEVRVFRVAFGNKFKLIFVDAPLKLRYNRAKQRNRAGGPGSFKEFCEKEKKEAVGKSFGIEECIKSADVKISNSGSIEELKVALRGLKLL